MPGFARMLNSTGNITDPKAIPTNENRLVKIGGALQCIALLINLVSLLGFCMHWSVRWKWARDNTSEHVQMMISWALVLCTVSFVENVFSGFTRSAHFVVPADTPYTSTQAGYYDYPANLWCKFNGFFWSFNALFCVTATMASTFYVYFTTQLNKIRIKKVSDLPTYVQFICYVFPFIPSLISMIAVAASGIEMGDMNGMYCGIRCPELGLEDGNHVNKGKNCHMWRFVHVYAWMFLFLPMMIFFSAKNIIFIWGHAEKMVASSKGGSGSRSEAKLFQAMSKLAYFGTIVAILELATAGSRLLAWIRSNPASEGYTAITEFAWPICTPFWFIFFGRQAWENYFKYSDPDRANTSMTSQSAKSDG